MPEREGASQDELRLGGVGDEWRHADRIKDALEARARRSAVGGGRDDDEERRAARDGGGGGVQRLTQKGAEGSDDRRAGLCRAPTA